MNKEPQFVDDGLMVYKNVTVYVCDADDAREGGYDVHLNVGDDDTFDHIMFDSTATLYNRGTLPEAWIDAAEWLAETADTMRELADHIKRYDIGCDDTEEDV